MNRLESLKQSALGMVSTRSFPAIIDTADAMVKASGVVLVGIEKIGSGYCTILVRGRIADIRLAVEAGARKVEKSGKLVSSSVIPRPLPNLEVIFPIGSRLIELAQQNRHSRVSKQALGLLETRGFPAMVGAADAMLKSAEVKLTAFETVGDGLCTAIIRGSVADVAVAVQAGVDEAKRIGELNAVTVIPRPLDDLDQILPVASCLLLEQPQPLQLPITVKEASKELVKLPDLENLSTPNEEK
ncbi:MAG: BMC domain-containing protein [Hormoscilla sp. GUM202]|nr:BMC domain-containing protein [Hormoscilla sp. GUM202]